MKNELQIITLPDAMWKNWETFLILHHDGEIIDPVTGKLYKQAKGFHPITLKREFFKRFGRFTDLDFQVFAQHLLGTTPGRKIAYPKISASKAKIHVPDNMLYSDWVERRKRKKIVLQEIEAIKLQLKLVDSGGNVIKKTWKAWKARHRFTSATWDFLLQHPSDHYFAKRLKNEAWRKRAKDLEAKFPEVLHMFTRFMALKYRLPNRVGGVQVRGVDFAAKALVVSSHYTYTERPLNLAVLDVRNIPRAKVTNTRCAIDPFLDLLRESMDPKLNVPSIWLLILLDSEDIRIVEKFAAQDLPEYDLFKSEYVPAKAEMLNSITTRGLHPNVTLFFLFKKKDDFARAARKCIKPKYDTPPIGYYMESSRNTESKWRDLPSELRMEFYLEILRICAKPEENVVGIYAGAKFMLASKVINTSEYTYRRVDDSFLYVSLFIV